MTWVTILFYTRLVEFSIMIGAIYWVISTSPPSHYRTLRLTIASVLTAINVFALIVCVFALHRPLPW